MKAYINQQDSEKLRTGKRDCRTPEKTNPAGGQGQSSKASGACVKTQLAWRWRLPRVMCRGPEVATWPLTPSGICWILPPAARKRAVCSSIDRLEKSSAGVSTGCVLVCVEVAIAILNLGLG